MKKYNQKGIGHLLVILFIIAFAGIASFALMQTFAAQGGGKGGGKKGGDETTLNSVTIAGSDMEVISWSTTPDGSVVEESNAGRGKKSVQKVYEVRSSSTNAGPNYDKWNSSVVPWLNQNLGKQVRLCAKVKVLSAVRTVEVQHAFPVTDDSVVDNFLVMPSDSYTEYCTKSATISHFDQQKIFNRGSIGNGSWDYSGNMQLPEDGQVRILEMTYQLL